MKKRTRAFTLTEVLLAMTILGVIIGSVITTMQVGVEAYFMGKDHLELYQNARIALRKMSEEFRFSLTSDAFWRPADSMKHMTMDMLMQQLGPEMAGGMLVEEEDPGAVRFMGDRNSVLYVRKVYQLGKYPPFDLQECRIYVDKSREALVLEIIRSLLAVKQASWYYRHFFQLDNLSGIVIPGGQSGRTRLRQVPPDTPLMGNFIGNYGMIEKKTVLAEGITDVEFRYSDGDKWQGGWDSQEIIQQTRISPQSPNFNPVRDVQMRETGPPAIVEVTLKLNNGDTLATATDIPAGDRYRATYEMYAPRQRTTDRQPRNETQTDLPRAVPIQ